MVEDKELVHLNKLIEYFVNTGELGHYHPDGRYLVLYDIPLNCMENLEKRIEKVLPTDKYGYNLYHIYTSYPALETFGIQTVNVMITVRD